MDKVTEYSFAIGTLSELKNGKIQKVHRSENYIKSFFNEEIKRKISLPNFVGVYRYDSLIAQKSEECDEVME